MPQPLGYQVGSQRSAENHHLMLHLFATELQGHGPLVQKSIPMHG